jgi:predicted nucleic acid-binding protein
MLANPLTRLLALQAYRQAHAGAGVDVVPYDNEQMDAAFQLYGSRADKAWSLTDCLSFVVMEDLHITKALTADQHFKQAGFRALLLEDPPR